VHKVYIGADPRQVVSLTVLAHSIQQNASEPVEVIPLVLENLPIKRQGLTPFTYSRFLVPHLCGFDGWGLFLDADMLCLGDITDVFRLGKTYNAVHVMQEQPAFEWASMILFNCGHPANKILTPEHIENPETRNLHKIGWVPSREVGTLPLEWNVCVPYSFEGMHAQGSAMKAPPKNPKLVHFTQGVPHWWETADQPYADLWRQYRDEAAAAGGDVTATVTWFELMGRSVHADPRVKKLIAEGKVADVQDYLVKAGLVAEAA
jgi:lipopolysaccharide biosynthesis glycosyltransferase